MIPIAVVGIDCRFPGAPDKDAFWRLMLDGLVTDTEVPAQRFDIDTFYHPEGVAGSTNSRRGHFIDMVDAFDNEFFGMAPVEAAALDPQQRLLLQSSWRALEDAGFDPRSLTGTRTGVFVGVMSSEWSSIQLLDFAEVGSLFGTGCGYFMTANRISYHLGLTGPSVAIDSACSSSLTAIHQGCAALRAEEADTVIAAGVNLILTPALSIYYTRAGLSAPDGRCKPFRRDADGIGRGEGVAAVVLRRLDDALADRQPIYAVVRSSVTNHDGRSNGITAPSRRSQAALMRRALHFAEVGADQLAFVEAHGTGTVLGDMIEAGALGDVHRARSGERCLLGSVKGNIGHTEGSAGIAAFIKACLALHLHVLPPTVVGDGPNPAMRLEENGLTLADAPTVLPEHTVLGAVSSFGLGGGNAHAILGSAPPAPSPRPSRRGVLTISAPSAVALRRNASSLGDALRTVELDRVGAWCRSTNNVKRSHQHRVVLDGDRDMLVEGLEQVAAGLGPDLVSAVRPHRLPATVGLLFSGQGTQYAGMTRPLYAANPVYRKALDTICAVVTPHLGTDLRPVILGLGPGLDDTGLTQPALFAVSFALGQTLLQSGIRVQFGIGHSLGEISAACVSGVLDVDAAARLVVARGRLMGSLPSTGAMIAIDLSLPEAEELVAAVPDCLIAAVNGARAVTISGTVDAVARVRSVVRRHGGSATRLAVSHAFHSPLMEPIVSDLRDELTGIEPRPAEFPLFSTVYGRCIDGREMTAGYWARQICAPVRFHDAVRAAATSAGADYLAEAGPRSGLLSCAMRAGPPPTPQSLVLCSGPDSDGTELLGVAATLMRDGYSPDLTPLYGEPPGPFQRLPAYVFDDTRRFWFDGVVADPRRRPRARRVETTASVDEPDDTQVADIGQVRNRAEGEVLAIIADVGNYAVGALSRSQRLTDDLGYDSLLQVRLLDRLRKEYPDLHDVDIAELLPRIHRVGDLVDYVVAKGRIR
ncbi:type I polyketide synthase [Gordonia sp. NPDC003424]